MKASERIILALDVNTRDEALKWVDRLGRFIKIFKVGMQLYYSAGPQVIKEINDAGGRVFLDLKFHDIPNTVAAAGRIAVNLNCFMFNVHAAGGREMMQTVVTEVKNEAQKKGFQPPMILAVTVLTSLAEEQVKREMFVTEKKLNELVVAWAMMAKESGLSGVVCSPNEIQDIRKKCGHGFKIVTPGVRPRWSDRNDQKRITTPRQAIDWGADYVVIGRPITKSEDPIKAVQAIIHEMEE
ncbi:MAG: orotidine-5'-phosphate decarboxylase [Syntrophomonadaceae bacterium]|jgi:orotidine-5'-phosphate decarboxylase